MYDTSTVSANSSTRTTIPAAYDEVIEAGYYPVPFWDTGIPERPLGFPAGATGGMHDLQVVPLDPRAHYMGFRLPLDVIALDVDHHDSKTGMTNLAKYQADNGLPDLPRTYRVTSRGADDYGKALFQVSADDLTFRRNACPDVEVITARHMFVGGVPGTVHHKTGNLNECYGPDGEPSELPDPWDLPSLPLEWEAALSSAPAELASGDAGVPADDGYDCPHARSWWDGWTRTEVTPEGWRDTAKSGADFTGGQVRGNREISAVVYLKTMALHGHHVGAVIAEARDACPELSATIDQRWHAMRGHAADSADCCKGVTLQAAPPATTATLPTEIPAGGPESDAPATRLAYWCDESDPAPATLLDCGNGPVVRPATLGMIHAPEKQGKTWAVMAWAVLEALKGRRVLYIDYENGARRFARRMRAVARCTAPYAPGSGAAKTMAYLAGQIGYMPDPEGTVTDAELAGYDLVLIDAAIDLVDNHTDTSRGIDTMNSAQAVNRVYRRLSRVARDTGACVVLVDHSNSEGKSSGSRRKRGAVDWSAVAEKQGSFTSIAWEFDRDSEEDDDKMPVVYLVFDGYRLQSWAPRPDTPPSLDEFAKQNALKDEQVARYRQIVMAVAGEPSARTRSFFRSAGFQARDIDALIALDVLTLDGESRVRKSPVMPAEWRWWWMSGSQVEDQVSELGK